MASNLSNSLENMKILLVEDNNSLALNVSEFLEAKNFVVDYSADGKTALNLALGHDYDAIVLDIMLPGLSGFSFCQQFREITEKNTPILMLTAKDSEKDKLNGFSVGTDDYVVKPFSLPELEARLLALIKRSKQQTIGKKELVVGDLTYSPATMTLKRGDTNLYLKPVPRKILVLLMKNSTRVVTRQEIEHEIWNDFPPDSEALRSHIYAIRSEINKNGSNNLLQTIRGVGYIIGETG